MNKKLKIKIGRIVSIPLSAYGLWVLLTFFSWNPLDFFIIFGLIMINIMVWVFPEETIETDDDWWI